MMTIPARAGSGLAGALVAFAPPGQDSLGDGPRFVEVARAAKLEYVTERGPDQPGLSTFQQVIHANLGHGAAVGDYDRDGDLDVYLLGALGQPNALFRNDLDRGRKTFTEVTRTGGEGLGDRGLSRVAHFVDLDDDGWLDLLLVNDTDGASERWMPPSRVFRNRGDGTFEDVTARSGFDPTGFAKGGASLADYDGDGLLDVYVTNWSMEVGSGRAVFPGHNRLYRNLGDCTFADVTEQVGLPGLARDSFTSIFTDLDDDGAPDLYVAIDHTADALYWNRPGGFVDGTVEAGLLHAGNDMGVACGDYDDDGDLDLYVTNISDADPPCGFGTPPSNVFYVNQASQTGRFELQEQAHERGVDDTHWGWGVEWTDVENDGDLDLLAVTGFDEFVHYVFPDCPLVDLPSVLFLQGPTGKLERTRVPALERGDDSRTLIAFDYDRDGDEDLLVTNMAEPVRLYENRTATGGHWLSVRLTQRAGLNRFGVGARVQVEVGGSTKRRDLLAGESYLAGTPAEAHFGLGSETVVDVLRVRWTDGTETVLRDVPADRMVHVVQAGGR